MKRYIRSKTFETLEQWCKTLNPRIHTLFLHHSDGKIIGKFPVQQAVDTYGEAEVTNSYSDGNGQISVWLI